MCTAALYPGVRAASSAGKISLEIKFTFHFSPCSLVHRLKSRCLICFKQEQFYQSRQIYWVIFQASKTTIKGIRMFTIASNDIETKQVSNQLNKKSCVYFHILCMYVYIFIYLFIYIIWINSRFTSCLNSNMNSNKNPSGELQIWGISPGWDLS